jgi:hypothetical protein
VTEPTPGTSERKLQPSARGSGAASATSAGGHRVDPPPTTYAQADSAQSLTGTACASTPTEAPSQMSEATLPQQGIFSSSRLSDRLSAAYNESVTVRLSGSISITKLTRALERLTERHDALRASFNQQGNLMHVAPALRINVPTTDLSIHGDANQRERLLRDIIAREMSTPFRLPGGPSIRAQIVVLQPNCAAVILSCHHVVCDGWSLDVLVHDLCAVYSEELSGKSILSDAAKSYCDYACRVNQRNELPEYEEARNYWHEKFTSGFPVLVLPTDHSRRSKRDFSAERLDYTVPDRLVSDMRRFARDHGSSFLSVVLSGLSILLGRIAQQDRFVLVLPFADQPAIGQTGLVGHCVSLLPFLVELHGDETIGSFIERVQSQLGEIENHRSFTLLNLMQDLRRAAPAQGISPIPVGLTSIRKFEPHELPQHGFSVTYDFNPKSFESFECYLNAIEIPGGLIFHCHYSKELFHRATIESWLADLGTMVAEMVRSPWRRVAELVQRSRVEQDLRRPTHYVLRASPPADRVRIIRARRGEYQNALHSAAVLPGK